MFKKSKWQEWRERQNPATLAYLDKQPIWHDRDITKAVIVGVVVGIAIGFLWGYSVGLPDLSRITHTGVIG